jgi:hypothetical protein
MGVVENLLNESKLMVPKLGLRIVQTSDSRAKERFCGSVGYVCLRSVIPPLGQL